MSDINYSDLPQKTTASVPGDFVIITDSEDGDLVKIQDATLFKGPTGDTGPTGPQGIQGIQGIQGVQGDQGPQGIQGVAGTNGTNITGVTSNKVGKTTTVTITGDFAGAPSTFDIEDGADGTGSGDVIGPATNTDSYIPQWDGTNSKTLKNGIPTSTFAPALGIDDNYVTDVEKTAIGTIGDKAPTNSPTFTGTVTLPKTTEIQDTTGDHQYILAVNELTADRTVTLPLLTGNDEFVFKEHTQTFTNKRITSRITTITSSGTPTINTDNCDCVTITALAEAITSMTTNLSGTPTNFQKLIIRIKDNGTARAITWGTSFEAKGVALPTTTVLSKVLTVGFIYDTVTSKWGCVASVQET